MTFTHVAELYRSVGKSKKCTFIFCADHGVAKENVSAYPQTTTADMVRNYLVEDGAAANAFAKFAYSELYVVDVGVDADIADFAFFAERDEHLTILLEPKDTDKNFSELAESIDEILCNKNSSYADARRNGLPCCQIIKNQVQSHLLYRDVERFTKKTAPDQIKPTHFLNTPDKIKFFLSNIYDR